MANQITYTRGDTCPIPLVLKNPTTGDPRPLTGKSYTLTVNSEENPEDTANQLLQMTGVITDAANGKLYFKPADATESDFEHGDHWFDIQEVVDQSGEIRTVVKGVWIQQQDITK